MADRKISISYFGSSDIQKDAGGEASGAGVYIFELFARGKENKGVIPLYIGQALNIQEKCFSLMNTLLKDPSFFGMERADMENDALELRVRVLDFFADAETVAGMKGDAGKMDKLSADIRDTEEERVNALKPRTQYDPEGIHGKTCTKATFDAFIPDVEKRKELVRPEIQKILKQTGNS